MTERESMKHALQSRGRFPRSGARAPWAPQTQFCPNEHCLHKGLREQGDTLIHSVKESRYRRTTRRGTFGATTGTAFCGLRMSAAVVTTVVTPLSHGCPPQAIVAAFGLDERTVASWQQRAGAQCQRVHTHLVQAGQVDLRHGQADEVYVTTCTPPQPGQTETGVEQGPDAPGRAEGRGHVWQAMDMAVPSRLWLGGVISAHRDKQLIQMLAVQIRACALTTTVLVCVDGLSRYVGAIKHAFSERVLTGKRGRPPRVCPSGLLLAQVVKTYATLRVVDVSRRAVLESAAAVTQVLTAARTEVAAAHSCPGRGSHRSPPEHGRTAALSGAVCALGGDALSQAARPPAQSPSVRGPRMITLKRSATLPS